MDKEGTIRKQAKGREQHMSYSTSQISGVSSGIDWRSIVDDLAEIEHERVDLVETQKNEYAAKLSEWQSVNTKLLAVKSAAESLSQADDFNLFTAAMSTDSATLDGEDILALDIDSDASVGTYTVAVTSLATGQKLSSNPFSSRSQALGSDYAGDIVINGKAMTIKTTDTLADVAKSINNLNQGTDPSGVTATIVRYSASDYRLVISSDSTGADGISLLNGSAADVLQQIGWKDAQADVIKNEITNGAQSDAFSAANVAVASLLGLSAGEASSGSLTIDGTAVAIDLSSMSLTDIRDAVNNAAISGVSASIVSQTQDDGTTLYRLQIDGTQSFVDENNILNTLGILDNTSSSVTGKIGANALTKEGTAVSATTLLTEIDGYNTFTAGGNPGGDYITLTGTATDGTGIGSVNFDISSATTLQDLLDEIEAQYGQVVAYVTGDGQIRVDDLIGGGSLAVTLNATVQDPASQLDFGAFGDAAVRQREIVAGQDAVVEIDGVQIESGSNTIDDVIQGVSIDLNRAAAGTTVTMQVKRDVEAIKSRIQEFVDAYNTVMTYINEQFAYNEDTESVGGILFADGTLSSIKTDLSSLLTETVWGVDSSYAILAQVGVAMDNDLQLSIDDAVLTSHLKTNFSDVAALFVGQGTVSDSSLAYVDHNRYTQAGAYTVHIDQPATRGTQTGSVDLSAGGVVDTLTLTQGGAAAVIAVTADMTIDDIVNSINTELDTVYTEVHVSDESLFADNQGAGGGNYLSASTTWDTIYDGTGAQLVFSSEEVISFEGTDRSGKAVSGSYTITDAATDTVAGLLNAVEDAFQNKVTAAVDAAGRIVITDKFAGASQLSLTSIAHQTEGEFWGAVDVSGGAGDGSREGRYAMGITAADDGAGHLVLQNDVYGDSSFTIAQDSGTLGLTDGDVSGQNVAGTINGEAATGNGQLLTGDADNANTAGLYVRYTGAAVDADVGTITITNGIAELFDRTLFAITDPYEGYVAFKEESLQSSVDRLDLKIEAMEERIDRKMSLMIQQFVRMETAMSQMQNQSQWLAGQLNAAAGGWG